MPDCARCGKNTRSYMDICKGCGIIVTVGLMSPRRVDELVRKGRMFEFIERHQGEGYFDFYTQLVEIARGWWGVKHGGPKYKGSSGANQRRKRKLKKAQS